MARRRSDKRQKTIKTAMTLFIVVILLSSTIAFVLSFTGIQFQQTNIEENGYDFEISQDNFATYFTTEIDENSVTFLFLPSMLTYIQVDDVTKEQLRQPSQFTFVPNATLAPYLDLARVTLTTDSRYTPTANGVTNNDDPYTFLPVVDCSQASEQNPVLVLRVGDITQITAENNCITAQAATPRDILAVVDTIRYIQYNII